MALSRNTSRRKGWEGEFPSTPGVEFLLLKPFPGTRWARQENLSSKRQIL